MSKNYLVVPIEELTRMKDGLVMVYKNHWWATDGTNVFFYKNSHHPQCNTSAKVVDALMVGSCNMTERVLIPWAFVER
jgi:hypothetical protein